MGGHDLANTRNHEAPNPDYGEDYLSDPLPYVEDKDSACGCGSAPVSPWGLLVAPLLVLRRRGPGRAAAPARRPRRCVDPRG